MDIGAANGKVLSEIGRVAPHGQHIAYEPLEVFNAALRSRFPQVDVRGQALSDADGETTFTYVRERPWVSGFRRPDYSGSSGKVDTISVRTERLDDHLPAGYVPHFIKVDVEGAEEMVFRGALRTIAQYRPIVAFQHRRGSSQDYPTTPGDIFRLLTGDAGLPTVVLHVGSPDPSAPFERAD